MSRRWYLSRNAAAARAASARSSIVDLRDKAGSRHDALVLVVFAGRPGTGKTTLAHRVGSQLRAAVLRIDTIETAIIRSGLATPPVGPVGYLVAGEVAAGCARPPWGWRSSVPGRAGDRTGCSTTRTPRFFDDCLLQACREGIRQVALLAAGLDTRAYRLSWPAGVRLFELELPDVLAFREPILGQQHARERCHRLPLPVDLRGDWPSAVPRAGLDPQAPTAWLAEGLMIYLSATEAEQLLSSLAQLSAAGWPSSTVPRSSRPRPPEPRPHLAWLPCLAAERRPRSGHRPRPAKLKDRSVTTPATVGLTLDTGALLALDHPKGPSSCRPGWTRRGGAVGRSAFPTKSFHRQGADGARAAAQ